MQQPHYPPRRSVRYVEDWGAEPPAGWNPPEHSHVRMARARQRRLEEREHQWIRHLEARRALVAQVEWQPAPPDLNPAGETVYGQNFLQLVNAYVDAVASEIRTLDVLATSVATRLRVATNNDDATFAATRLSPVPLTRRRLPHAFGMRPSYIPPEDEDFWVQREHGTERSESRMSLRSEVGPNNASYLHSKTATLVDTSAVLYKRSMEGLPVMGDSTPFEGYRRNLPPDLQPFYEMELRCDPSHLPHAYRADIEAWNSDGGAVQAEVLCVCRVVERFRTFRGDDNDNSGLGHLSGVSLASFGGRVDDQGPKPAYVILTAIRMRALGNLTLNGGLKFGAIDDFVVVNEDFNILSDLRFDVQQAGWPNRAVSFVNPSTSNTFGQNQGPLSARSVVYAVPLTLSGDCLANWKQLSRAVRSVGPALAEARERAADRVYAPDAAGARAAQANFERLVREQEQEAQRRRDREARQEEGQSPQRTVASGAMPSLAALRL